MNYWLNLFTGTTWREFQVAGAKVTGFREHNWKRARGIKSGDIFLCYMVGLKGWVGLLQVIGERFRDNSPIFGEEAFPVRFPVEPVVVLPPEHGVPMTSFEGKLSFYEAGSRRWSGRLRNSPTKYTKEDGDLIAAAIREAQATPIERAVDPKQLRRSANLYKLRTKAGEEEVERIVSVPTPEEESDSPVIAEPVEGGSHAEIQWRLLDLGAQLGLNVWAPRGDRGKMWNSKRVGDFPSMLDALPTQFDEVTNRTIENIDVLWFSGQAIVAAFEVEHSTSIYSGLLRMSDLLTMQPNLDIKLYLVAPDERHSRFEVEVARATFASRKKPLHSVCGFLPYSKLCLRLEEAKNILRFVKPEFLDEIAEYYDPADEVEA
jgi:hypothetical protein